MTSWSARSPREQSTWGRSQGRRCSDIPCWRLAYWLALITFWGTTACAFPVDYSGTSFQCTDSPKCPPGFECFEGHCVPADEAAAGQAGSDSGAAPSKNSDADVSSHPPRRDAGTAMDAGIVSNSEGGALTPDAGRDVVTLPEGGLPALPYASGAATAVVLSDGLHYLGGSYDFAATLRYQSHYVYQAQTDTWSSAPADVPDDETFGARAHAHGDRLYLLGGYPNGKGFRVFDPATNRWSALTPPPTALARGFASGVIDGALYAFGNVPGGPSYKYDFTSGTWSGAASIPQNAGGGALSSEVVGSKMYVLNGNADDGTTVFQIYDSKNDRWIVGPRVTGHVYETAATAVDSGRVFFFGGAANHDISDSSSSPAVLSNKVQIFDTATNTWSFGQPMNVPRMWATAALYEGQLYVLGGLDARSTELDSYELYGNGI